MELDDLLERLDAGRTITGDSLCCLSSSRRGTCTHSIVGATLR
jgi:hypothetical protein